MENYKDKTKVELINESEANLKALFNNRDESIWSLDRNLNFLTFNDFFAKAYFDSFKIKLEKGMNVFSNLNPEFIDFWKPKYEKVIAGEKFKFEYPFKINNILNCFEISLIPIVLNNEITGLSAISINITKQKTAEETEEKNSQEVKLQLQNIDFLRKTASRFVDDSFDKDIYSYIGKKIKELIPDAYILISEIENKNIIPRTIIGIGSIYERIIKLLGHNPIGKKYEYDEGLIGFSDESINKLQGNLQKLLSGSMPKTISAPIEKLLRIENIYGIAFVNNQKIFANAAIVFPKGKDLKEKETLETFIKQASLALKRQKGEQELSDAKIKAEQNEIKYKALVENSHDGIYLYSNNRFIFVNNVICEILGYSKDELFEMDIWNMIHPDDRKRMQTYSKNRFNGEYTPDIFQSKVLTKDHKIKYAEFSVRLIEYENEQVILGAVKDVTERHNLEEELLKNQKKDQGLADIIRHSPVAIAFGYPDGRLENCNAAFSYLTGYSEDELKKVNWSKVLTPSKWNKIESEQLKKLNQENNFIKYEKEYIHKNGKNIPIELSVSAKYNDKNKLLHYIAFITNITERKESAEKISRYSRIFENSLNEIFLFETKSLKFIQVNTAALENLGYTFEELNKMTPVDIKPNVTTEAFKKLIEPLYKKEKEKIVFETVHQRKDKSLYNVEVHLQLLHFENEPLFVAIILDISERIKNQQELKQSEEKYKHLVENNTDLFVKIDSENRFQFVSQTYCKLFGKTEEELLNNTFMPFVHEDDRELTEKSLKTLYQEPYTAYHEQRAMTKIGWRWLAWSNKAVLDDKKNIISINAIGRDITKQKMAESEVKIMLNTKGEITLINKKGCEILGYSVNELLNKNWFELLIHEDIRKDVTSIFHNLVSGKIEPDEYYENLIINKNGETRLIAFHNTIIRNEESQITNVLFSGEDITERKHIETEVIKYRNHLEELVKERTTELEGKAEKINESQKAMRFLLEDVNDAREELDNINKKLSDSNKDLESFAYSVSHDLKSPLRAINGYTNVLMEDFPELFIGERKEYLDLIVRNSVKMNSLIDDLLRFSRAGRSNIDISKFNLSVMVNDVLNMVKVNYKNQKIKSKIQKDVFINADIAAVKQVLQNLIHNAVKFSVEKEITEIEFGSKTINEKRIYYIKDNGIGFDTKYAKKLFEVFQRLHSSDKFEGTGVGLALVKRIINKHGGDIWAESEIGKGSTFYFTIS